MSEDLKKTLDEINKAKAAGKDTKKILDKWYKERDKRSKEIQKLADGEKEARDFTNSLVKELSNRGHDYKTLLTIDQYMQDVRRANTRNFLLLLCGVNTAEYAGSAYIGFRIADAYRKSRFKSV